MNSIPSLAIAVTFFYLENRLPHLKRISTEFGSLAEHVTAHIVTNTENNAKKDGLRRLVEKFGISCQIYTPKLLGHPYLLTWCHMDIFRSLLQHDQSTSHFMYVEDDMLVTRKNIQYWLKGRECLKNINYCRLLFAMKK